MLTEIICIITALAITGIIVLILMDNHETFSRNKPPGVCVFDIDNTLTANPKHTLETVPSYNGFPASEYAAEAIKQCRNAGYGVAVATAEIKSVANSKKQRKFLKSVGINFKTDPIMACPDSKRETKTGSDGKSYQACNDTRSIEGSVKKGMYEKIAKHFGVDLDRLVIFDDDQSNLRLCRRLTGNCNNCVQASKNCGGRWCEKANGLTESDFKDVKFPPGV